MNQLELFDPSCYQSKVKASFEKCFCSINDELEKLFDISKPELDAKVEKAIKNISDYLKRF